MSEKSETLLKQAETRHTAATAALGECEAEFATLDEQIAEQKRELARIDALDQVEHEHVVAQENAKRRVRKLKEQRAGVHAKVVVAQRELETAELALDSARRDDLVAAMRADETGLTAFIVHEVLPRLVERLERHRALVAEATSLNQVVRTARGTPHDSALGVQLSTRWSSIDLADPWEGIGQVVRGLERAEKEAAATARRTLSPEEIYEFQRKSAQQVEQYGTVPTAQQ